MSLLCGTCLLSPEAEWIIIYVMGACEHRDALSHSIVPFFEFLVF